MLLYELINEAFSNGSIEYNLLHGGEEYKNQWTKSHRQIFTANIYNKTLRANLAETVSKSKNLIKGNLKKNLSVLLPEYLKAFLGIVN